MKLRGGVTDIFKSKKCFCSEKIDMIYLQMSRKNTVTPQGLAHSPSGRTKGGFSGFLGIWGIFLCITGVDYFLFISG